jgi:hypothetical protein
VSYRSFYVSYLRNVSSENIKLKPVRFNFWNSNKVVGNYLVAVKAWSEQRLYLNTGSVVFCEKTVYLFPVRFFILLFFNYNFVFLNVFRVIFFPFKILPACVRVFFFFAFCPFFAFSCCSFRNYR